ncbi:MAG: type II secretion system GspH family protein [Lachnoclostridium sp.]|nr:type II secretion system GspH family protein [Lachnospira sp.]MCM1246806.1 type II secretion system GspH family protein [Lachnoclostridium sp.]MCM1535407.1 type II secretion system GspH family protein [Clostridium sp.]
MDKKRNHPPKLNDDGLTLMEILVATIIFSLVAVVFLRSFVYALQMNEQAKQKQYSMILAQSLMESVKAYDKVNLDEQFDPSKPAAFMAYDLSTGGTAIYNGSGDYELKDIVYQGTTFNDRYKYDVKISVSPSSDAKHQAVLMKVKEVNAYNDAIYVEGDDEQSKLRDAIIAELGNQGHSGTIATLDESKISATRTVNVTISNDDKVSVQAVYDYSVTNYPITKSDGTHENVSFTGTVNATDDAIVCYDKSLLNSAVKLTNFYCYYYPAYSHSVNGRIPCSSDEINITNESGTLENIYVIKQESSDPAFSVTELDICEASYSPKLSVNTSINVNLFHNLKKQLHSDAPVTPPPTITSGGTGIVNDIGKAPWEYKEMELNPTTGTLEENERALFYDVTVTVYKSGSTEPICEIVGSSNAKQ